jgi:hypothetical protein
MDLKQEIYALLDELGFNKMNAQTGSNEIFAAIIEDTYSELLSPAELQLLQQLTQAQDRNGIIAFLKKVDQEKLLLSLSKYTEHYLSLFFKNIVDQCPNELLEELQLKLQKIANKDIAVKIKDSEKPVSLESLANNAINTTQPQAPV